MQERRCKKSNIIHNQTGEINPCRMLRDWTMWGREYRKRKGSLASPWKSPEASQASHSLLPARLTDKDASWKQIKIPALICRPGVCLLINSKISQRSICTNKHISNCWKWALYSHIERFKWLYKKFSWCFVCSLSEEALEAGRCCICQCRAEGLAVGNVQDKHLQEFPVFVFWL